MPVNFFSQEIKFTLKGKTKIRQWLSAVAKKEGSSIDELSYIFCSDEYLLELNKKHLNHNTLTDIITFDNSDDVTSSPISGDIFISIDRVKENAAKYSVNFDQELRRVLVHGLLHLLGYKDKKTAEKAEMTGKEDQYLKLF